MKLFEEINLYINKERKELLIFTILNHYDKLYNECFNMIDSLITKLLSNIDNYHDEEALYNLIDNDFITLQDLIYEYKEDIYQEYDVKTLAYISNFKEEELVFIYKTILSFKKDLSNNEIFNEEIKKALDEEEINNFNLMATTPSILKEEMIIAYIKRKDIDHEIYLRCASSYLNIVLVK